MAILISPTDLTISPADGGPSLTITNHELEALDKFLATFVTGSSSWGLYQNEADIRAWSMIGDLIVAAEPATIERDMGWLAQSASFVSRIMQMLSYSFVNRIMQMVSYPDTFTTLVTISGDAVKVAEEAEFWTEPACKLVGDADVARHGLSNDSGLTTSMHCRKTPNRLKERKNVQQGASYRVYNSVCLIARYLQAIRFEEQKLALPEQCRAKEEGEGEFVRQSRTWKDVGDTFRAIDFRFTDRDVQEKDDPYQLYYWLQGLAKMGKYVPILGDLSVFLKADDGAVVRDICTGAGDGDETDAVTQMRRDHVRDLAMQICIGLGLWDPSNGRVSG